MHRRVALSFAILLCLAAVAQAVPTIVVGTTNQIVVGQTKAFLINVTGGDQISTIDMNIQIGDGTGTAPKITSVEVVGNFADGWIFAPNGYNPLGAGANSGAGSNSSFPPPGQVLAALDQFWQVDNITVAGTVAANGLIARVTIDATGAALGTYPFTVFTNGFENPSNYSTTTELGVQFAGQDGTLTVIVPEPATVVMGLFAAASLGAVVIRRRRSK